MHIDSTFLMWVFLVVVAGGLLTAWNSKQRQTEVVRLSRWATQRGWSYRPNAPELTTRWSGPPFVGRGQVTDVFSGLINGLPFTAFDYSWTSESGEHSTTYHYPVVTMPLPAALPLLWVLPQNAANQLSNPLGAGDITFESAAFNDTFMVSSDNDRYAYAVVHPRMMEYLMGCPFAGWGVRIEGNNVIFFGHGPQRPDGIASTASWLAGFVSLIPGHVYDQWSTTAATGYAGSVTGLRPEATGADLIKTAFVGVWALIWLSISGGMAFMVYGVALPNVGTRAGEWSIFLIMPALFIVIGVVVVTATVVRLIRGGVAIRQNRRDRERMTALAPNQSPASRTPPSRVLGTSGGTEPGWVRSTLTDDQQGDR
jgi:hypothetical protein